MSETPDAFDPREDSAAADAGEETLNDAIEAIAEDSLDSLRAKLEEAQQQELRAHAELENYRKRTQRAMEEDRKYAAMPLLRDLLPVLDNLSRALSAADDDTSAEGIAEGVKMVVQQLEIVLEQYACRRFETVGQPFDPSLHEAVGQQPHEEIPANHVSMELQTGYKLHDRVVRPAQVYVSTGPANSEG